MKYINIIKNLSISSKDYSGIATKLTSKVSIAVSILFAFLLSVLTSCEEFLTVEPQSTLSPELFLTNEANAELALNGVYAMLNAGDVNGRGNASSFRRGMLHMLNSGTDETVGVTELVDYAPYYYYTYSPSSNFGRDAWLFLYTGISRANFLLDSIDKIPFQNPTKKTQIIAEARFLRAIYYQYLAWMYGGIPIKINTFTGEDIQADAERNSLQEVYAAIESDLLYAYQNLDDNSRVAGAANKWSAAGYLSKMYIYLASCKENNVGKDFQDISLNSFDWVNSDAMYGKAYEVNSAIIGKKSLTDDYFHLFRSEKNSSTYNEVLFGVEATNNQDVVMIYVEAFIPQGNVNISGGGYGYMRPGMDLYNKYDRVNDLRFKNNITANHGANVAALTTEVLDGSTYYVPLSLPANITATYRNLCIGKWRYPKPGTKSIETWASDCNFQLIRYADILLLQAELEFKYKKDEAAARNYLKLVRERAVKKDATKLGLLTTRYNKINFMDELLDERSRELCFETWRRIDLIRTGKLKSIVDNNLVSGHFHQTRMTLTKSNFQPYHIWYPIPINEFINKKMIQNFGY